MNVPARYQPVGSPMIGGMSHAGVFLDQLLNRKVVIKGIQNPANINRLIDEIRALQDAKSKHVVEIFDVIISPLGNDIYIVEEYLPGSDLDSYSFSAADRLAYYKLGFQIATGLRQIHDRNVVHRDIKPNNIKRDASGYIRIFDFGLAKSQSLPAMTKSVSGTEGYMAPELFSSNLIDKPVDVYAYGALMFRLLTGNLPPCAKPFPQPPVALAPGQGFAASGLIAPPVADLLDRALGLKPEQRPTAEVLADAFERELLFGQHTATIVSSSQVLILNTVGKTIKASHFGNSIQITYDGYDFRVGATTGAAYVNNQVAASGLILDGSYVITLGAGGSRLFVTFDVSHPEVTL